MEDPKKKQQGERNRQKQLQFQLMFMLFSFKAHLAKVFQGENCSQELFQLHVQISSHSLVQIHLLSDAPLMCVWVFVCVGVSIGAFTVWSIRPQLVTPVSSLHHFFISPITQKKRKEKPVSKCLHAGKVETESKNGMADLFTACCFCSLNEWVSQVRKP